MVELCARVLLMHLGCDFGYVLGYGLCLWLRVMGFSSGGWFEFRLDLCYVGRGSLFSFWIRLLP